MPQQLLVGVRLAVGVEQVEGRVVGLDPLPPVPVGVGGGLVVGGAGSTSGRGRQRPVSITLFIASITQTQPSLTFAQVSGLRGQVAVDQPDPGQAVGDLLDGPLDPARRLGGHRRVVEDVPGLDEPAGHAGRRRGHLLDDAVDRVAAVRR